MNNTLVSICIPNYNRPDELFRLLKTIDASLVDKIEIIICDDRSPRIMEVKDAVDKYKENSDYKVIFRENEKNLGYDKNLRACANIASGEWILYMGNDDEFVPGALDKLINFIETNNNLGYVLKSHYFIHKNLKKELFKYYKKTTIFQPGFNSYISLFRKSVFISGFMIKRDLILPFFTDKFDGTLLFQLYILAEVVLKYPAAYFDEPLTQQYDEGFPEFGNAESEKLLYTPGSITVENSVKFLQGYFKITKFIDEKYNLNSTLVIKKDMSKYFYPSLAIQRVKGIRIFMNYVSQLNKIGFNCSIYYYIYIFMLIVLGKKNCDNIIRILKNLIGRTPQL